MEAVAEFAAAGGAVLGICNGFQVLCEAGLLPGALLLNQQMRFVCRQLELVVEGTNSPFISELSARRAALAAGQARGRALLRAARAARGDRSKRPDRLSLCTRQNPNGSAADIAGVFNRGGNVLGMMPIPSTRSIPSAARPTGRVFLPPPRGSSIDGLKAQPARPHRPRVRADRRAAWSRAQSGRAGDVQPALVRALRLQALPAVAAAAPTSGTRVVMGPGRMPARSTSAAVTQSPSRSSHTTTPAPWSRFRARLPGWAASSATSSPRREADRDPRLAALWGA